MFDDAMPKGISGIPEDDIPEMIYHNGFPKMIHHKWCAKEDMSTRIPKMMYQGRYTKIDVP